MHLSESLDLASSWINPDLKALPLVGIADWLLANGTTTQAMELAACVASKPTTWNEVKEQARNLMEEGAMRLSPEESRRNMEQGEEMSLEEACSRGKMALSV